MSHRDSYDWSENQKLSPTLTLMHVSRTFRQVMLQSRFWLDFGWDLQSFIRKTCYDENGRTIFDCRHGRLLHALLDDRNFVECLARKTDWALVSQPEIVFAITGRIPNFDTTVRNLWLAGEHAPLYLSRMKSCRENVTEFGISPYDISPRTGGIYVTQIADFFPNLTHLHVALPVGSHGSLQSLNHLIHLELTTVNGDIEGYNEDDLSPEFLPIASAQTLTTLEVYGYTFINANEFILTPFQNLRHLRLPKSCTPNHNVLLSKVSAKLISLDVDLKIFLEDTFRPPIEFDHICLSTLERLTITVFPTQLLEKKGGHLVATRSMDLVEAVTDANLRNLTELGLEGCGIDISRVGCLSKLEKLNSLAWAPEHKSHIIGQEDAVVAALQRAFESRVVKPKIRFAREREGSRIDFRPDSRWPWYVGLGPSEINPASRR